MILIGQQGVIYTISKKDILEAGTIYATGPDASNATILNPIPQDLKRLVNGEKYPVKGSGQREAPYSFAIGSTLGPHAAFVYLLVNIAEPKDFIEINGMILQATDDGVVALDGRPSKVFGRKIGKLKLALSSYWQEIDQLQKDESIPDELGRCLKSLIGCHKHNMMTPEATPLLIGQAKEYLAKGIELASPGERDMFYDIVVCVPDKNDPMRTRKFFQLIPRYPRAKLRYLDEL